jgi:hypothetical protein
MRMLSWKAERDPNRTREMGVSFFEGVGQCQGLGMYDRFFTYLECIQVERTIDGQVLRTYSIESNAPMMKSAKIKEAPRLTERSCRLS